MAVIRMLAIAGVVAGAAVLGAARPAAAAPQAKDESVDFDRAKWVERWKKEAAKYGVKLTDAEVAEFLEKEWSDGVAGISRNYAKGARTNEPEARKRAIALLTAEALAGRSDIEAKAALRLLERFADMPQERAESPAWFRDICAQLPVGERRTEATGAWVRSLCRLDRFDAARKALAGARKAYGAKAAVLAPLAEDIRTHAVRARLQLGRTPPELAAAQLDGQPFSLAKCRGRVTVVFFWSRTSKTSVVLLARLNALWRKHRGAGLRLVGVGIDADVKKFASFCTDWRVAFPQICEGKGWASPAVVAWAVNGVPRLWVIGRGGKIRAVDVFAHEKLDKQITQLLAEKPPKPPK